MTYLFLYIQNIIILTCNDTKILNDTFYIVFLLSLQNPAYISYTHSSFWLRPVTLEMLNSVMWIVDAVLERTDLGIQKWGMIGLEQTEKALGRRRVLLILFLLLISTSGKNEQFIFREQVWGRIVVNTSGFPGGSDGKASACNAGDLGLIPGSGRSPGEGNWNPLQ